MRLFARRSTRRAFMSSTQPAHLTRSGSSWKITLWMLRLDVYGTSLLNPRKRLRRDCRSGARRSRSVSCSNAPQSREIASRLA